MKREDGRDIFWVDAHCDALSRAVAQESLVKNSGQFDLVRAQGNGSGAQVLALFPGENRPRYEQVEAQLALVEKALDETGLPLIRTGAALRALRDADAFGLLLGLEGADALEGDFARMEAVFARGVRLLGLTWNWDNAFCFSCVGDTDSARAPGLTALGRDGVRRWEALGGLIDVSHASERGFWDAMEVCGKPVIASHSCCGALRAHRRNLTDAQIRALAGKGCVMGINFCPAFLREDGKTSLDDVVRHILHAVEVGGEDMVGLGSDFDGIGEAPEGLCGVEALPALIPALERAGLPGRVIEKVCGGNFCRVLTNSL